MTSTSRIGKTVLVLDDSEIALEVARGALESAGYAVVTSTSTFGFSRLCMQTNPDLVVVDVNMPALAGDRLVEILRRFQSRPFPIVLHSDRPAAELKSLALACGANGSARKSADCAALLREIERLLR
jgi:CheY-like chemotaxis protein